MNKRTNTLLFILAGTVFNIVTTMISFIILLVVYMRFFSNMLVESGLPIVIIFILSIVISFVVYRQAVKIITKKVDMEKYFDPILGSRRSR